MKKIFFFTLFSLCSPRRVLYIALLFAPCSNAQGNLQFNQVKLVSTVETVPAGKVWKVEGATFQGGQPFCLGTGSGMTLCSGQNMGACGFVGHMSCLINGQPNYIYSATSNANPSQGYSPFPIWLPAGSTLAASTNMRYLSVLEFNIIP